MPEFDTPHMLPNGAIAWWSGSTSNIPNGWVICDGTNGTPDLRDRHLVGAGTTFNPDDTGGSATHAHGVGAYVFTAGGTPQVSINSAGAGTANHRTHTHTLSGTLDTASSQPPFYSLYAIKKIGG